MDNIYFIVFFCVLTILFIFGAIMVSARSKRSIIAKENDKDFIDKISEKKDKDLRTTPGSMSLNTYAALMVVIPLCLSVLEYVIFKKLWPIPFLVIIGAFVPEIILRLSAYKQRQKFEERYARALRQMSSSLRAGLTIQQAVSDLCACPFIHYEIRKEFRRIDSDIKLGISVPDAFENMAKRVQTADVQDVASAIRMQSIVGGGEAEAIGDISTNISSRIMLRKEIKSIFANIRMTVIGMDLLPVIIIVSIFSMYPAYFQPCFESAIGRIVLIGSILMMLIGTIITQKMLKDVKEGI